MKCKTVDSCKTCIHYKSSKCELNKTNNSICKDWKANEERKKGKV